ncbi:MAG: hypothetical protein LDL14_11495 [Nitrospira sp.]|nr:hypothetical protein [Nitrospira sp.]
MRRCPAEQGIRRIETVTDRVIRCRTGRKPELPAEWGCIVAQEDPSQAHAPQPAFSVGEMARRRSGPAAGFVGRLQAVRDRQVTVEMLIWGKGVVLQQPATDMERIGRLPWERGDNGNG